MSTPTLMGSAGPARARTFRVATRAGSREQFVASFWRFVEEDSIFLAMKDPPQPGDVQKKYPWQKDHLPNLTGTVYAYHPQGSLLRGGQRAPATGDYEPWQPE